MKKIINNRRYDTETAEKLGIYVSDYDYTSFHHYSETLYRKRGGEYFLYGAGGATSRYGEYKGNYRVNGEQIIPMTVEMAQEWAEEHLDGDEYESIFGEVSEDEEDQIISCQVPAPLAKKLTDRAAALGISKSEVIRNLIEKM